MASGSQPATTAVGCCVVCTASVRTLLFHSHDRLHGVSGTFALMRCEGCGCIYPDPRPAAGELLRYYPSEYAAYVEHVNHVLFARRTAAARLWYATQQGVLRRCYGYEPLNGSAMLAATIGRLPFLRRRATFSLGILLHPWRPDGVLLDVGCGSGIYLDLMRALGWRVVGNDFSPTAVQLTRDGLGIEAHAGDLRDVGLPAATFDAVSMSHVLEHMDDPVAVLSEVRRVTKPGGRIAIIVPNVRSLLSRVLREHWVGLDTPRHLVNFTPGGLRIALARSGLRVESLTTPPAAAFVSALMGLHRVRGVQDTDATADQRLKAGALAGLELAICAAGAPVGEVICVVARA